VGGDRHRVHPGRRPQRLTESPPSFVKGAPDSPVWVGGTLSADLRNSEPIHDIDTLTAGSSSIACLASVRYNTPNRAQKSRLSGWELATNFLKFEGKDKFSGVELPVYGVVLANCARFYGTVQGVKSAGSYKEYRGGFLLRY
jgi:hypothetical protein